MFVSQEANLTSGIGYRSTSRSKSKSREKPRGIVAKSAATKDPEAIANYVNSIADNKGFIKKATLIALLKVFGKYRPTNDAERVLRRLSNQDGLIPKAVLIQFFEKENRYERGRLTEEDYGRVFDSFSRDGVLTFQILMKYADELANRLGEKEAKGMVRLFGLGKDHITKTDFIRALTRHERASKSKSKDNRKSAR